MGEHMVLDVARRVAELLELRHELRGLGALVDEARTRLADGALEIGIEQGAMRVVLELRRRGMMGHSTPPPDQLMMLMRFELLSVHTSSSFLPSRHSDSDGLTAGDARKPLSLV